MDSRLCRHQTGHWCATGTICGVCCEQFHYYYNNYYDVCLCLSSLLKNSSTHTHSALTCQPSNKLRHTLKSRSRNRFRADARAASTSTFGSRLHKSFTKVPLVRPRRGSDFGRPCAPLHLWRPAAKRRSCRCLSWRQ